jgi:outer membrane receptor protein involved in Fe transport
MQPITGLLGLRWRSADATWFLEGTAELARHQDRLAPGDVSDTQRIPPGGTGGYQAYSLRAAYQATPQVRFFAECENVLNEDYRYHGSGINEPGTNLIVGTQIRF